MRAVRERGRTVYLKKRTAVSLFCVSTLLFGLVVLGACGGQTPYGGDATIMNPGDNPENLVPETCGQQLTTRRRGVNGRALQGMGMTAATVTRITKGCSEISDLRLEGTTLIGNRAGGIELRGKDFIGATVTQTDVNGSTSLAVIAGVEADSRDPSGETFLYSLRGQDPTSAEMKMIDLCAADADGLQRAIPLSGKWDATGAHIASTDITFGCTSAAVGKCVRMGYRPWQSRNGTSLADFHQSCTRMVRFDYCGDGVSHTQDGTEIDAYDRLSINARDNNILSLFDGAWTPNGAYCIERQRWLRLSLQDILTLKTLLPTECLARFELTLLETSPVDALDICAVRRKDLSRTQVTMDNRSGLNITLL